VFTWGVPRAIANDRTGEVQDRVDAEGLRRVLADFRGISNRLVVASIEIGFDAVGGFLERPWPDVVKA
jgi:hypothetical protein